MSICKKFTHGRHIGFTLEFVVCICFRHANTSVIQGRCDFLLMLRALPKKATFLLGLCEKQSIERKIDLFIMR